MAADPDDKRALIEQAHQIDELTRHPGWAVYQDFIRSVLLAPVVKEVLNDSGLVSLEAYKKRAGLMQGLQWALDVPKTVNLLANNARERDNDAA